MGDKLRKIGNWIWLNKERLILAVMVVYLGMRVVRVVQDVPDTSGFYPPPARTLSDEKERQLVKEGILPPATPPPAPAPYPFGQYGALEEENMFYMHATTDGEEAEETADWGVRLLRVSEPMPGRRRAQLQYGSNVTEWHDEGEGFGEFRLESIDTEAGTATIYSTEYNQSRTFNVQ